MIGSTRVTKRQWYDTYGGFRNPHCWRREVRGVWQYFVRVSDL